MKAYLIIPMGGKGQRFLNQGYKIYKPFLPLEKKNSIFNKIMGNVTAQDIIYLNNYTSNCYNWENVVK